ncbi:MAG: tyrosine-type recombinase/integrase, partial [Candidatus Hodarchaeota archaeon]
FRDDLLRKRLSNYKELDHEREQKTRRGINKELKELRVIFNWAYKHDYLNVKVFDKISFLPVDLAKPVALTKTELKLLRRNLPKSAIRIIFYIGKNTGMRRSEILRMKRKDIDLENRIIHIEKTKNREASKKIIPPELHRIFKWIKITEGNPDELLFHYSKWWITDSFRKAMKKAGIKKRGAFHLLRHTYVTTILRETKNIYLAQKAAGHRNIATTKIYEHLTEEDIKDEISAIKF